MSTVSSPPARCAVTSPGYAVVLDPVELQSGTRRPGPRHRRSATSGCRRPARARGRVRRDRARRRRRGLPRRRRAQPADRARGGTARCTDASRRRARHAARPAGVLGGAAAGAGPQQLTWTAAGRAVGRRGDERGREPCRHGRADRRGDRDRCCAGSGPGCSIGGAAALLAGALLGRARHAAGVRGASCWRARGSVEQGGRRAARGLGRRRSASGGPGSSRTAWTGWPMIRGPAVHRRSPASRSRTSWWRRWSPHRRTPRTGRGRRWPNGPGCRGRGSGGSGRRSTSSRTARTRSSCPPTRCSWRRSSTSSGSTSTRPRARSCCRGREVQVQALARSQPAFPMMPGMPERRTHDYVRHGTTSLFAAFNTADGTVISCTAPPAPHGRVQEVPRQDRRHGPRAPATCT